ncbi:MAG TPA: hypothetical protein VFO21_09910 [Vicinamibacterales bacterium]|nr:hypothetical protein [Vicinamibacterales bacterium]
MSHTLVTIISKVSPEHFERARDAAESLGNPASMRVMAAFEAVAEEPGNLGVHFSSMTVFPATGGGGHLVFEFSADGDKNALIVALAKHLGPHVDDLFAMASDRGTGSLAAYWKSHEVTVGQRILDNPGVLFAGTPGLSVARIRNERRLRNFLERAVEEEGQRHDSALAIITAIRNRVRHDPSLTWALTAQDAAALHGERSVLQAVRSILPRVFRRYLWPLTLPFLLTFVLMLALDFSLAGLGTAVMAAIDALVFTGVAVVIAGGLAYLAFRRLENSSIPDDRAPNPAAVARIVARENHAVQNHLAGISRMKAGWLRRVALKLVFAAIAELATYLYRPGWLGTLGTIHFARWVMVPGTGDLVFLSNYGGSWESYLEDFITKAANGLTAVWSNSEGFPRTANLIQLGAADGDRFKRWGRRNQAPTGCWYTAYPDLTTAIIRTNAAIRQGLGTIVTEEEARRWLLLFGSRPRPALAMEVNEIQTLTFGGLGFLRYGMFVAFQLRQGQLEQARSWLREMNAEIAFGDGRKHGDSAVILGLGATGLAKLGLPAESLDTFPPAFIDGMASPSRSRILNDAGRNAPERWEWGGPENAADGMLLLYAKSESAMAEIRQKVERELVSRGHRVVADVPFMTLPAKDASPDEHATAKLEPFGFVDGVSQPVIRGTYKSFRGADAIHLVEPGEFILGYPDNRGTLPAAPTMPAIHDPHNVLPIATQPQAGFADPIVNDVRDIGRNGTFLAVRQLEQDVDGFWRYCDEAAAMVHERFPAWKDVTAEFIGAKLVGRWPDGSSLVRYPYQAGSEKGGDDHPMVRPGVGAVTLRRPRPSPPSAAASVAIKEAEGPVLPRRAVTVRRTTEPVRAVAVEPDNDFLFGAEDPQGLRCPFGAHVRRANPRESFDPGSQEQLAITNRHRILRVGRRYEPRDSRNPGLFFMCLNADLERQFEFIQQTWLQSPTFAALTGEDDPVVGSRRTSNGVTVDGFTIPTREAPVRLRAMPEFVRTLGGGYYFVPGRSLLRYLAS